MKNQDWNNWFQYIEVKGSWLHMDVYYEIQGRWYGEEI